MTGDNTSDRIVQPGFLSKNPPNHDNRRLPSNAGPQSELELQLGSPKLDGVSKLLTYNNIHVSKSTFLNSLASRVHRWFRLTPSFGPELVREMFGRLDIRGNETILDPFAGSGTTLIEAQLMGRNAFGFEVNPLLHFVSEASLDWSVDPDLLKAELKRLSTEFRRSESVELQDIGIHDLAIPPIHNPTRWWRPDVLVQLLFLRRSIMATIDVSLRRHLLLALAGALVPDLTNVTLGRLQLHFVDRNTDEIDVWGSYCNAVNQIVADLEDVRGSPNGQYGKSQCFLQDCLDLSQLHLGKKISAVITSPPYPNRYSYVWNTRPHLYMLGFITSARQASELDKQTIGGTWGSATSELASGEISPANPAVDSVVSHVVKEIRAKDNLMANYVMHYFNRLSQQVQELERIIMKNNRIAYVVGNSWIKGVYVETDVLLGEIVERMGLGYHVLEINRFRRRHSGVRLYESIVYASK